MEVARGSSVLSWDWRLGVTASSEELDAGIGSSWVQLSLTVEHPDQRVERLQFELTVPQFSALLKTLEAAQQHLGDA